MSRYRRVDVRVWNDARFMALSDDAKMLWLHLLTTPLSIAIPGVIVSGPGGIAEAMGWLPKRLAEPFAELLRHGSAKGDFGARVVWLPNALKRNPPANPNAVASWSKAWDEIPECELKTEIGHALKPFAERFAERLGKPFAELFPQQDTGSGLKNRIDPPKGPPQGGGSVSGSRRKSRPTGPTPDEMGSIERVLAKLNERSEVVYRATTPEHHESILKRLRGGYTELQLRMVVWHQANRWAGDEAMAHNLNPTTLFKRQKFAEYVAQAEAAWRKEHGDQQPTLRIAGGTDVHG